MAVAVVAPAVVSTEAERRATARTAALEGQEGNEEGRGNPVAMVRAAAQMVVAAAVAGAVAWLVTEGWMVAVRWVAVARALAGAVLAAAAEVAVALAVGCKEAGAEEGAPQGAMAVVGGELVAGLTAAVSLEDRMVEAVRATAGWEEEATVLVDLERVVVEAVANPGRGAGAVAVERGLAEALGAVVVEREGARRAVEAQSAGAETVEVERAQEEVGLEGVD